MIPVTPFLRCGLNPMTCFKQLEYGKSAGMSFPRLGSGKTQVAAVLFTVLVCLGHYIGWAGV